MTMRAKVPVNRSTVKLTHYGRKTGKPYRVTIWFVVIDGKVWIGSMKRQRNWVKNVHASGRAELEFGSGPIPVTCRWADARDIERTGEAIRRKYYILAPILMRFVRGEPCAFETDLEPV